MNVVIYKTRKTLVIFVVLVCATMIQQKSANGQATLWEQRDSQKAFLFQDLKARQIGDLLTIVINEVTDVANQDSRALNKQTSSNAGTNLGYGGTAGSGAFNAAIDGNSARNFDADVAFSSAREFTDRFSVVVVDVLPNGNLLVAGKRTLVVEGDVKTLTLTGTIRGNDIRGDNSILSQQVAEMAIQFEGSGVESKTINQGWLNRSLNRLWPF